MGIVKREKIKGKSVGGDRASPKKYRDIMMSKPEENKIK